MATDREILSVAIPVNLLKAADNARAKGLHEQSKLYAEAALMATQAMVNIAILRTEGAVND